MPPNTSSVLPADGEFLAVGNTPEATASMLIPENWVITAGFQNMPESAPPAAMPA
ncbi:hypothetical protein D3C83_272540 [compost metagenome]